MDFLAYLVIFLGFYLIPTWIANDRKTHNRGGIFVLNLLLGWTVIGWLVAFIMACGSAKQGTQTFVNSPMAEVPLDAKLKQLLDLRARGHLTDDAFRKAVTELTPE